MAKKKPEKTPGKTPGKTDVVDAAMALAAAEGWDNLSLNDIAQASNRSLPELYAEYPSKRSILDAFQRRMDAAMLEGEGADEAAEPVRDRLFAIVMRRFDALTPHKAALRSIMRAAARDPVLLLGSAGGCRRTVAWMLEGAGLDSSGLRGAIRRNGFGLIYMDTLRIWLNDDSPDLARTMSALDRRLRQAESFGRWAPRRPSAA